MLDTLESILEEQIKDLYSAETQLLKALPKMAAGASSPELRQAFESHLDETRVHIERLEEVAELLEIKPGGKKCKGMEGLIEEGAEVLEEEGEEAAIDVALIVAAQKVEHYEISAYGSVLTLAQSMGNEKVVSLLEETLDEEKAADEKLTEICEEQILPVLAASDE